jgi:hypothetical protein
MSFPQLLQALEGATRPTVAMALAPLFRKAEPARAAMFGRESPEEAGEEAKGLQEELREVAPNWEDAAGRVAARGRGQREGAQLRAERRPEAARPR